MKFFPLVLAVTLFPILALAGPESYQNATSGSTPAAANITQGDWKVSGHFDFMGESGRRESGTSLSTAAAADYFLLDQIALGLQLSAETQPGEDSVALLGPRATWYFWSSGHLATFVGADFRLGLTDATVHSITQAELGAEYFIVPTVAFGPSFFFRHYDSHGVDYNRYGVAFGLGIYL